MTQSSTDPYTLSFSGELASAISQLELPLRLLLVEDSRLDAALIRRLLEKTASEMFLLKWVSSLSDTFRVLDNQVIDLVLLDLNLLDSYELETFAAVSAYAPQLPIVVLTGDEDRDQGFEAIRRGAQDYLIKGHVGGELLIRSLVYAMERKRIELTERQQAEMTLKENEKKYEQLFEYESDALLVLDADTDLFENANRAAMSLFGYSKDEFRFISVETIIVVTNSETRAHFARTHFEHLQSLELPTLKFRKKGGQVFFGEITVRSFVVGGREKYIASIRDTTQRQKMESDLRKSEGRFRMLVESAADAFFLHDLNGKILDVNQQACESLSYDREELLSFSISAINDQFDQLTLRELWMNLDSGLPLTMEGSHRRKDGSFFPVEVRLGRFFSEESPLLLSLVRDITQRKQDEARRLFDAYHDGLTRLPNRTTFLKKLDESTSSKEEFYRNFSVLFVDLDRFKKINDSLGHETGDNLIIGMAGRLKKVLRKNDSLARLSADEFAILYHMKDVSEVHSLVREIMAMMEQPFALRKHEVFCSVGLGISLSTTGYEQSIDMLRDAEIALHHAKALGRARVVIFDQKMRDEAILLHQIETHLRRAVKHKEFLVYYQPIVDLSSGRITSFEALVRWMHPKKGLLTPDQFLHIAEESNLIVPLGWQVLTEACRQAQIWNTVLELSVPIRMGVNVASMQFEQGELLKQVKRVLEETKMPPDCLKLEMTETTLMENSETVTNVIDELDKMGIGFAMDDFGTGYSSLSYLHQFPVETLKIDRSFISRMKPNDRNTEIVQTIVALAQALDLIVIAEGIETAEQLEQLRELGCDFGQGYYFSPPVDATAAEQLLRAGLSW